MSTPCRELGSNSQLDWLTKMLSTQGKVINCCPFFQCDEDDRNHMKKMLPLLQSLADNHPDAEVQAMASDLRVAIATHGVVWSERLAKSSENKQVGLGYK